MARYRVKKTCFVNGALHVAGDVIDAPDGMKGAALEPVEPPREKPARAKPPPLALEPPQPE